MWWIWPMWVIRTASIVDTHYILSLVDTYRTENRLYRPKVIYILSLIPTLPTESVNSLIQMDPDSHFTHSVHSKSLIYARTRHSFAEGWLFLRWGFSKSIATFVWTFLLKSLSPGPHFKNAYRFEPRCQSFKGGGGCSDPPPTLT